MSGFKVTVEDLATGEKQAMVVSEGDYMLTLKDHRPAGKAKVVDPNA